ncbi:hypothetical protein ACU4GD_32920 [Cupriavidus basilensis]
MLRLNQEFNRHVVRAAGEEQHEDALLTGSQRQRRDRATAGVRWHADPQATGAQAYRGEAGNVHRSTVLPTPRTASPRWQHDAALAEETDASVISMEELARLFQGQ